MTARKKLSLIICTYRRPQEVKRLLRAIAKQSSVPDETLIIDGSPDEETEETVRALIEATSIKQEASVPDLKYFRVSPEHRGLTRQRNYGVSRARGRLISFLDDDTVPETDYFAQLLDCFERHPQAVGIGGFITNEVEWWPAQGSERPPAAVFRWASWERREAYRWRLRKVLGLASRMPPGWVPTSGHGRPIGYLPPDNEDYQVEFLMGGASTFRREVFETHQFSPYFEGYGLYEDMDFCVRVARQSRLYLCTAARLAHYHAPAGRPSNFRYGQMVVRNGWFVWRRRWPHPRISSRVGWWATTALLTACQFGDAVRGPDRRQKLAEALGRVSGMTMLLLSKPKDSCEVENSGPAKATGEVVTIRSKPDLEKLLIVSSAIHYAHEGRLFAYGPYAREIDIWADLFPQVAIAAPCRNEAPPADCLTFTRANITVIPQKETGGDNVRAKAAQLLMLPVLVVGLCRAMRGASAIHVRCPGNLGLLSIFLAPLFSRCLVAKYAGQWTGYVGEPWTGRLQRALLRSRLWLGLVTVYGNWANQPPHVVPFFTSVLTDEQLSRARDAAQRKTFASRPRVLYVGRLYAGKNVDVLLTALSELKSQGVGLLCDIVGDGPLRPALQETAMSLGLSGCVEFTGAVDFDRVLDFYERADVLVLASESEGWPKAIAEAMAFGLVCIGSNTGMVPEMLGSRRGILVSPGDAKAIARALLHIAGSPDECLEMSRRASLWARRYSLEGLRDALRKLLSSNRRVHRNAPILMDGQAGVRHVQPMAARDGARFL